LRKGLERKMTEMMNNLDKKHIQNEEMKEIRKRMLMILDKIEGGHKLKFATKINASTGNIDAWFKADGTTLPGFKALRNIAAEYRINLNWLVLGEGTMHIEEQIHPDQELVKENEFLKGQIAAFEKILSKKE